jgi:hypothetical protein
MRHQLALLLLLPMIIVSCSGAWAQADTWSDPDTGLMWAGKDNGSDANWAQAKEYCQKLALAGYSDWRVPTIWELEHISFKSSKVDSCYIRGDIHLSSCFIWSSSPGSIEGFGVGCGFNLSSGPGMFLVDKSDNPTSRPSRVLCVRGSGAPQGARK